MPRTLPRVKLDHSPLVLVLVQARFSPRMDLEEKLPAFRKACEELGYPVFRESKVRSVNLGPTGPAETRDAIRWDFLDKSQRWNILLSREFLMLQTTDYDIFEGFLERWKSVLEAARVLEIPVVERLGLRYVDLVQPAANEPLSDYLKSALAGYEPDPGSTLERRHHMAASVFATPQGQMLVRVSPAITSTPPDLDNLLLKGVAQPGPGAVFLDFDHSSTEIVYFEPDGIEAATDALHDAPDVLFREVVTSKAKTVWGLRSQP
ncbi:MAG: TIGR04255 family protein [Fibrobacteres bacterium]|nr:TIGR04255 family protein [Fibrobacterota bacterium]